MDSSRFGVLKHGVDAGISCQAVSPNLTSAGISLDTKRSVNIVQLGVIEWEAL